MRPVSLISALCVAAAILFWVLGSGGDAAAPAPAVAPAAAEERPVAVVAMHSEARALPGGIVLRGRTEAWRKVTVMAEVSGRVISDPLRAGARVARGDLLCEIDPGERPAALAQARAQLDEADARYRAASALSERGFAAETQAKAARAALEAARAAVRHAELEIARLRITAPFDGYLETNAAELGSLLQPGQPCATVIALDPIKLVGYAAETEIEHIRTGSRAAARLIDGRTVTGSVSFVSRSADDITRTFRVEVTAPNPDGAIRDGLTAEIIIELPGQTGHLLPTSALTLDDDGRLGVRIIRDGRARFVPVRVIRDTADGLWIAGLDETADVIIVGQEFVGDGKPVTATFVREREPR